MPEHSPARYWTSWELIPEPVEGLDTLLDVIGDISKESSRTVWRGVADQSWGLWTRLYRYVVDHPRFIATHDPGVLPTESEIGRYERRIIEAARRWGLDRAPAPVSGLELLARLQHTNAPTRLLDVSHDPLVGAWFATVSVNAGKPPGHHRPETDGRLFAMDYSGGEILDDGERLPFWMRDGWDWSARARRVTVWTPPPLDPRMSAQSGAFVIGRVPEQKDTNALFVKGQYEPGSRFSTDEGRRVTSIPIRAYDEMKSGARYRRNPVSSIRVEASAKPAIRQELESVFNLRFERLFPDLFGLSDFLGGRFSAPGPDAGTTARATAADPAAG